MDTSSAGERPSKKFYDFLDEKIGNADEIKICDVSWDSHFAELLVDCRVAEVNVLKYAKPKLSSYKLKRPIVKRLSTILSRI